jgi:hypothetical protein
MTYVKAAWAGAALLLVLFASGCASAPTAKVTCDASKETITASSFIVCKTTAQDIRDKLGKSYYEDRNADGRFVYVYETTKGAITFLFNAEGKLLQEASFAKK